MNTNVFSAALSNVQLGNVKWKKVELKPDLNKDGKKDKVIIEYFEDENKVYTRFTPQVSGEKKGSTEEKTFEKSKFQQEFNSFIQKYIEEYNRGNIITDVLVEYELISNEEYFGNTINPDDDVPYFDERLKINSKDNTITIKKVKDSYTQEEVDRMLDEQASKTTAEMLDKFKGYKSREEVIAFGKKVKKYCKDGWKEETLHRVFFEWDKWVEENL